MLSIKALLTPGTLCSLYFSHWQIVAGTLDDFAEYALTIKDTLPVLNAEIGDSWLYGSPGVWHALSPTPNLIISLLQNAILCARVFQHRVSLFF